MIATVRFWLNRLFERLWVRPLLFSLGSIAAVYFVDLVGASWLGARLPVIESAAVEAVLQILTGSMLVISTFAVGSMVSALGSASREGTPRTFSLIVADDTSQIALSVFVGAFIFGVIGLVFLKNDFFSPAAQSALLMMSVGVLALVILIFVHWVDGIARLGRLGAVIERAEKQATTSIVRRRNIAARVRSDDERVDGMPILSRGIGYVQRVDLSSLQKCAEDAGVRVSVLSMPGRFVGPGVLLGRVVADDAEMHRHIDLGCFASAFHVGRDRTFDEDPCFGLIVLSEIGSRALSSGINDPGTAIDIVRSMARILSAWADPVSLDSARVLDRVDVPALTAMSLFDDSFAAIARDGAGVVEVGLALQSAFASLSSMPDPAIQAAARAHSTMAIERASIAMEYAGDLERLRGAAMEGAGARGLTR